MAGEPPRRELQREELEAMRADVVAHISELPRTKRRKLRDSFEQTLSRIDARLARLREEPDESGEPRPDG